VKLNNKREGDFHSKQFIKHLKVLQNPFFQKPFNVAVQIRRNRKGRPLALLFFGKFQRKSSWCI